LDGEQFVLRIIAQDNNSVGPEFISEAELNPQIHFNISAAINITYKKLFKNETRYSGLNIFSLEKDEIIEQLLFEVSFQPFQIKQDNISIFIAYIGISDDETLYFARSGYISSFNHKVRRDQCLVVQTINERNISIHVYQHGVKREEHFGMSPKEIWKNMTICKEKDPIKLFGLTNSVVQHVIKQQMETSLCNFKQ
ncbi:5362_t:CDS:1, partial [Funneliformis caledonium]